MDLLLDTHINDGHNDPFDRMLLAQAKAEGMMLMSHDRQFLQYGNFVIPV